MTFGRLVAVVVIGLAFPAAAQVTLVAPTDKKTPQESRKSFKLPPGFEIQLVAAEPEIAKPMNIAFDARGRLWVTDTVEYPWPAETGKGRDTVKVLSDIGPDGRAKKVTTFATGLNIPLGVLPYKDGALVYDIPAVRFHRDTDQDGKADKIETVLEGFGSVDTHGMTNNFVRGFDGWVYANHGFRNDSKVKGTDGTVLPMQSGNTYRFRPDGTGLQFHARGQVNPFGLAFDPMGNLYSADCHTRPQYLLLRGAVYPSFGKPDDGLGFGPEMCPHDHGSTGIAGTVYYDADHFPEEYRGNLFNGNPVTNKVNRDRLEWKGSSPRAREMPDFLTSSDPWFRPVQVVLGPDGALYIADFYNKIIGHYEVDLKHPGRDRTAGRIWRIVYKGNASTSPALAMPDFSKAKPEEVVEALGSPNLTVRLLATNWIADAGPDRYDALVSEAGSVSGQQRNVMQNIHAMWVLSRWGRVKPDDLMHVVAESGAFRATHAMRMLAERSTQTQMDRQAVLEGLAGKGMVRRAALEAATVHVHPTLAEAVLNAAAVKSDGDTHLDHAALIAVRAQLAAPGVLSTLKPADADERRIAATAALGISTPEAADFLAGLLREKFTPLDTNKAARHVVKNAKDAGSIQSLVGDLRTRMAGDGLAELKLLTAFREGLTARGAEPSKDLFAWAEEAAGRTLSREAESPEKQPDVWTASPVGGLPQSPNPWTPQRRTSADGKEASFFSSLPKGETLAGVFRSKPFTAPEKLSFWSAGHYGLPSTKETSKNWIRLIDADTKAVLAEIAPPRHDTAKQTTWDLKPHAGKRVYVEAVDGDTRTAYAWLAFGRFEPSLPELAIPEVAPDDRDRTRSALDVVAAFKLNSQARRAADVLTDRKQDQQVRLSAAKALAAADPSLAAAPLLSVITDAGVTTQLRDGCTLVLATLRDEPSLNAIVAALATAPAASQRPIALALGSSKEGSAALFAAIRAGKASPRLLTDKAIQSRIRDAGVPNADPTFQELIKGVPDADAQVHALIDKRRKAYTGAPDGTFSADRGKAVFLKNCAACHRVGNEGAQVGPQLDGLGQRGVERVVEDILDPNRNVDGAFRYSILTLANGDVVTGLQRRVDGAAIVFADSTGKEFTVPAADIKKRVESQMSLMPTNAGEMMTEQEFGDLLKFLMK